MENLGKPIEPTHASENAHEQDISEEANVAHADNVRDRAAAAFLYGSMANTIGSNVDPAAYQIYRDQLLADSGNPHDPIEVMLVEATALSFFNLGRLHGKSANAEHHEVAAAYAAAATKLTGEFRRRSLAVAEYREKASPRLGLVDKDDDEASDPPATHRIA